MLKLFKNKKNKKQEFNIPNPVIASLNDIPTYNKEVENDTSYPSLKNFHNEPKDEEIIEMLQFDAYDKSEN